MKTELAEERMRKFYEDKAEAANKAYQKALYEVPEISDAERAVQIEEKKKKFKKPTPAEVAADLEFWKSYRKEKEKQKHEQCR